jgi:ABC-2 type transport system permease protein
VAELAFVLDRLQDAAVIDLPVSLPEVRMLARPRRFGAVNWLGVWNLYRREIKRDLRFQIDTLWGPIVANLLFLAVFGLATTTGTLDTDPAALLRFVAPGLVTYALISRAFELPASSLLLDRLEGVIADVLQPPIGPMERLIAMSAGSITIGLLAGGLLAIVMQFFVDMVPVAPLMLLVFAVLSALMLGLAGMIGGLWCFRWEHYSMLTTFFIVPASYLSGMFYPLDVLPDFARSLTLLNPIFYAIDGIRYGFTGTAQTSLAVGLLTLLATNLVLGVAVFALFRRGWRLQH